VVSVPEKAIGFSIILQPYCDPVVYSAATELSTRNLPVGKGRSARNADNFSAISQRVV
jgi:hypothetical protein